MADEDFPLLVRFRGCARCVRYGSGSASNSIGSEDGQSPGDHQLLGWSSIQGLSNGPATGHSSKNLDPTAHNLGLASAPHDQRRLRFVGFTDRPKTRNRPTDHATRRASISRNRTVRAPWLYAGRASGADCFLRGPSRATGDDQGKMSPCRTETILIVHLDPG